MEIHKLIEARKRGEGRRVAKGRCEGAARIAKGTKGGRKQRELYAHTSTLKRRGVKCER